MVLCYHCGGKVTEGDFMDGSAIWHNAMPFCYLCAYKRGYVE